MPPERDPFARDPEFAELPSVDVVILTWNDGDLLHSAVHSAAASVGVETSIFVIDNGSVPPAALACSGVQLERNETNHGVAPARNQGVRLGISPYVCLLDSDARLEPDTLATLVANLTTDERVGLAAPVFVGQPPEASAGRAPTLGRKLARAAGLTSRYRATRATPIDESWAVDFAIGACQVFRRDAFESVGGLDDGIFYGPEDVDFCLRLRDQGWKLVQVSTAICHHPPRRRNRAVFTRRGLRHARAVLRHLWRHRARRPR